MARAFSQLRSFIADKMPAPLLVSASKPPAASTNQSAASSHEPHPSVGFRVTFNTASRVLTVTVMAARHLPARVGSVPAAGYIVKVKLYPGKDKFETASRSESWPQFDESFSFTLPPPAAGGATSDVTSYLTSNRFLTFTVLGVDKSSRRKPLGSATWPLDHNAFTRRGALSDVHETPEVWKRVQDLSTGLSGISAEVQQRRTQRVKDQLELSLCHTPGQVGDDDVIKVRVHRLRWSLEKTKEYQHKEADLYVKVSIANSFGQVLSCIKTLCFAPSISVAWDAFDKRALLEATVPPLGPRNRGCSCIVTLCAKLGRGKKAHLGRVVIRQVPELPESESAHWAQSLTTPGVMTAEWHNLLPVEP